jgi:ABC-type multidrug transport system permease subunit
MHALLVILRKDLRLLWRDRAGLIFLTLAPIVVISVAGFSLANLYGADPTGQTAYEFPFVDEDGSELARRLRERLAAEHSVNLRPVADRATAEDMIRRKLAGSALVVPRGTEAALRDGKPGALLLYSDAVKYLERLNVRAKLLEMGDQLARGADAEHAAAEQREHLRQQVDQLRLDVAKLRAALDTTWEQARVAREQSVADARVALERHRQEASKEVVRQIDAVVQRLQREAETQADALRSDVRAYLDLVARRRAEFALWLAELQRRAGSHAADIPAPPDFPELPPALQQRLDANGPPPRLPDASELSLRLPPPPRLEPPPLPPRPPLQIPEITLPEFPKLPGTLTLQEVDLSGGSINVNTFDQNVPGFSVTFLLLGMLLGVSLGLLDERDWGTLSRVRAMPVAAPAVLVGKLLARFVVGVVQMITLLVAGWLAFDVSLGPQPWALLLPTVGIVFAGTAFGLVVAAVAPSREAVLPVGSIVIVTMAAVGGCWWPIDLEPRWMRTVALAFPTTWAMDAFNDLMIRRRTFEAALRPTAVMLAYGALYLVVGVTLFSRRRRSSRG